MAKYSEKGVAKIFEFARSRSKELKRIKEAIINHQTENNNINRVDYPIMKLIDMYFWKIGYNISKEG